MKKRYITLILAFVMVAALALAGCGTKTPAGGDAGSAAAPPAASGGSEQAGAPGELVATGSQSDLAKDKIVIGGVRSSTGTNAIFEQTAFGPQYKMWVDQLNKDGGIYVKSLDRKVPVELKIYDDGSEISKTTQLYEQLLADEKVDIIIAPVSTAALFAVAPIAQKYGYYMVAAEGGAKELEKYIAQNPNVFSVLGYSETQVPAFVKFAEEQGIESVFCAYIDDLHGTEYWGAAKPALEAIGVEIKGEQSVPLVGGFDANAVINAAKASGADAFLAFTYPDQGIPIALSAIALNYNPKLYLMGPGGSYDFIGGVLWGASGIDPAVGMEGVFGWGGWNEKSSARAAEYSQAFREYWIDKGDFWLNADGTPNADGTVYQDWWGHASYYSVCEIYQQAIENAGALTDEGLIDNALLVEYTKDNSFDTVLNQELRFTNNILLDDMYLGNIGQWQNGTFEVMDVDDRRTADPIYPKPEWPTK
ncbi:MAG: ABC transporter substrate-binding protein [Clostridiales Family XIII bacterium]|jgi:branched-chain amino acid transport system substrate-binding protein|nr:ABC transporter substrate-binding protein [Clostridiales Family XIII bacterium]